MAPTQRIITLQSSNSETWAETLSAFQVNRHSKGIIVSDAGGKRIRECGYIQDGTVPVPQWAHIPGYGAYLGVRVDMTTVYALLPDSLGPSVLLAIDDNVHALAPGQYSVRGTVVAEKDKDGPENQWVGEIKMEPVGFKFKRPE